MNQSNALHAMVGTLIAPIQMAQAMNAAELSLREKTKQSVLNLQKNQSAPEDNTSDI